MIRWRDINPLWKAAIKGAATFLAIIFIIWLAFAVQGCTSTTVIQKPVASASIAYEGDEQNAGVLVVYPHHGALLTDKKKLEYDALVKRYGKGTAGLPLVPAVKVGDGLTKLKGRDQGFPLHEVVWAIDAEALTNFLLFKGWQEAGRSPL